MNKYQEAWAYVKEMQNDKYGNYSKEKEIIQELVDKETPMIITNENMICKNCNTDLMWYNSNENYCYNCGQKLEWSENDDAKELLGENK